MQGSFERVRAVLDGKKPDRIPYWDQLHNDAVLAHFNDGKPVEHGDDEGATRANIAAMDGCGGPSTPHLSQEYTNEYGIQVKVTRWTVWKSNRRYASAEEYVASQHKEFAASPADAPVDFGDWYQAARKLYERVGGSTASSPPSGSLFMPLSGVCSPMMACYSALGLEQFSYYLADAPQIFSEILEREMIRGCRWAECLPADDPFVAVGIADDLAFKSGTIMPPTWMRKEYFPRLTRVIAAIKKRGKKVVFHSDGNVMAVLDDLVAAGIDALNPVETASGMNLAEMHRRHPQLVPIGGIPVTDVLAIGTPQTVRDAVVRAIEDTEGNIIVGSDSEIANSVPLENFLALREAVMTYPV